MGQKCLGHIGVAVLTNMCVERLQLFEDTSTDPACPGTDLQYLNRRLRVLLDTTFNICNNNAGKQIIKIVRYAIVPVDTLNQLHGRIRKQDIGCRLSASQDLW